MANEASAGELSRQGSYGWMKTKHIYIAVALGSTLLVAQPRIASAAWETVVIRNANSPVALTRCKADADYYTAGGTMFSAKIAVANRTVHQLISFDIKLQYYDADNVLIGTAQQSMNLQETLAPGITAAYVVSPFNSPTGEPITALARVTCRINAANFSGRKTWTYGQSWHEPLKSARPRDRGDGDANNAGSVGDRGGSVQGRGLHIRVANAWNDTVNGVLIVHDAVVVEGGASESHIAPSDFVLTMALANGARKTYPGLAQPAPTYQKYNALTKQNAVAYEVDPQSDLGRLGSVIVPAHATVQVTVSFSVGDPVADANANRAVDLR